MNTKHLLLAILLGIFCLSLSAQNLSTDTKDYANNPDWQDMMLDHSINFFETQRAFYTYWEGREATRGTGYKVFKRWEYYWGTRILPNGDFPEPGKVYREYQRYAEAHPVDGRMKTGVQEWVELGPKTRQNYGGYVGVGRINAIAFHPTDPDKIYIGAPSGGFWYTSDGGASWATSTDTLPTIGVSAIALHPESPEIILMGTGDDDGGSDQGLGVFKSIDGGLTWAEANNGMPNVTVCVFTPHETDNNTLLAGTKNGGIFKTTDFGETWTKTSAPDRNFRNIQYKPGDMSVVYASENGFWRSADGGDTWTQIGEDEGLTASGRMVIDVTPANDSLVYVLVGGGPFRGLFQSRDFGQSFTLQSDSPNILGWDYDGSDDGSQAGYDLMIHADPQDANIIHIGGINMWKSSNGGVTWSITGHWHGANNVNAVHADQHDIAFNPLNSRLFVGNDGGIYWTDNQGSTWTEISEGLGIGQIYKLGVSLTNRNKVITGYQDNGTATMMGTTWLNTGGGDGMECAIDPFDDAYSYSTLYYGPVTRRINNASSRNIAGEGTFGIDEAGAWVTPFLIAENNPNIMVIGFKNVWISRNVKSTGDIVWTKISNNLGGKNNNNGRVLEHSPADFGVLYYSRSDGMIFRTDKLLGQQPAWSDITGNKPSSSTPTDLECHPYDSYTVYMTSGTKVYKSENKGISWTDISGSLPEIPMNSICYDKTSDEGLYVGTDAGVYYKDASMEDWILHGVKLPVSVEVSEVEIYFDRTDRGESRLRASTYGRGLWEIGLAESDGLLPPALLEAVASTGIVELEWVAPFYPQNISGYNVYRNSELISTANGTSYLDRDVENEFTYEYYVTAVYVGSGESTPSNTASATPLDDIELPYNQDFEKGNAGWNAKYAFDGWEYGNSDELKITGNDGNFFGINSGMAGAGIHVIDTLYTPRIDLSPYAGQIVTMKFRYTIRIYMDYDHLFLAYKEPVGNSWSIVEELQKPSGFGWPWGEVEMELPSDWLVEDLQIGFIYDDSNEHGWGAAIDDFQLYINSTSIFDLKLASKVSVYPNPSNGQFEINIDQQVSGKLSLEILDLTGRLVYQKDLSNQSSPIRENIDLTHEAKGIYTLIIKNGSAVYQTKLTIQ